MLILPLDMKATKPKHIVYNFSKAHKVLESMYFCFIKISRKLFSIPFDYKCNGFIYSLLI